MLLGANGVQSNVLNLCCTFSLETSENLQAAEPLNSFLSYSTFEGVTGEEEQTLNQLLVEMDGKLC